MRPTISYCSGSEGAYPWLPIWLATILVTCLLAITIGHSIFGSTNRWMEQNARQPAVEGSSRLARTNLSNPLLASESKPKRLEQRDMIGGAP